MLTKNNVEPNKMTFTEFSESCRFKYAETRDGMRDHEGNRLLDKPKIKRQLKKTKRQLKLHKDALDRYRTHQLP